MSRRKKKHKGKTQKRKKSQKQPIVKIDNPMMEHEQKKEALNEQITNMKDNTVTEEIPPMSTMISQKGAMKRKDVSWLWAGAAGACLVILTICLIGFLKPEFRHSNYYICEDPSILKELLEADLNPADSIAIAIAVEDEVARRKDVVEDLLEQKIIVSSEDFASNISGYYNTLIAVLSAILIILNLFGFLSWRSNANVSLEQKQRELDDAVSGIDDRLESNLEEILRKNQLVRERLQSYLRELLDQRETLTDEEWDKLHLLLSKYEKQEVLKAIENDNNEVYDGEIEDK